MGRLRTTLTGLPALLCLAAATSAGAADAVQRIPFVVGLSTVYAVVEERGDYEAIGTVGSVDDRGYRLVVSAEVPGPPGLGSKLVSIARTVPTDDRRNARALRGWFREGDPEVFDGTTPGVSVAILRDLRSNGSAALKLISVRMTEPAAASASSLPGLPKGLDLSALQGLLAGAKMGVRRLSGTLTRIEKGTVPVTVLVNGRPVALPTIHAIGRLSDAEGSGDFEIHVLDDDDNPILLRSRGPGAASTILRIDYPQPAGSKDSIEGTLARREVAEVYGIYFAFGSDQIRLESERVLQEIANAMKQHADWKLQVDGHTDGIGGNDANLDLSRRRSAAVKAALVSRYGIAAERLRTDGHGAGQPKDTNGTPEGRARNRRVELRRM